MRENSKVPRFWNSIPLRIRIYLLLSALIFITMVGGLLLMWYTHRTEALLFQLMGKNIKSFQLAVKLETALANQKGYVSYYYIDGNSQWLQQLAEFRKKFEEYLWEVKSLPNTVKEKQILENLELEYSSYVKAKDKVLDYYKKGEKKIGAELHRSVRKQFFNILDLCEEYKKIQTKAIQDTMYEVHKQSAKLRMMSVLAILIVLFLGSTLSLIVVKYILGSIRRLIGEVNYESAGDASRDEIKALGRHVRAMAVDIDRTHSELEKSREVLLQSEKLALVGKLAAGMAHSIRNPLTSVKMRLFSLQRSLDFTTEEQIEDFEVISEEIRHIDSIVQNFLEFSRPPKPRFTRISPSAIVDLVITLLKYRFLSYNIKIELQRKKTLPEIIADPEQIKEVLVNIVINACEAMKDGGLIKIIEDEKYHKGLGHFVLIKIVDTGPGIPESIREKIFEPFFSVKAEGAGLGLSISRRIINEHGGTLTLESNGNNGATFVVCLPIPENSSSNIQETNE